MGRKNSISHKNRLLFGMRLKSGIMSLSMAAALLFGTTFVQDVNASQKTVLHNPVIEKDSTMSAGQKVTWDCVWFGSYPQTEVKKGSSEYSALKKAKGWDKNGDAVVNGRKYRRMRKDDATYSDESGYEGYYDWKDSKNYHYFRYEPVKWRVLKTDGRKAMLLSDIVLDDREYNTECEVTTWGTSTIRSWLNGYGAGSNQKGTDYRKSSFIDSAFTDKEQSAIKNTRVVNKNNLKYGTKGGKNTTDRLFLLSESEVYTKTAKAYGFSQNQNNDDEARRCKSSDYAKAMGIYSNTSTSYKGNCWWWLRSPGYSSDSAAYAGKYGDVYEYGNYVDHCCNGVRVALNLNLSSSNLYKYAGKVYSDGTAKKPQTLKVTKSYTKTMGEKPFKLNVKLIKGNGRIKYATSDKKVAVVDGKGNVTIKGIGRCTIRVKAAANKKYKTTYQDITITVK